MLRYSELYFTQYSAYIKLSAQNYILHFGERTGTARQSFFIKFIYTKYITAYHIAYLPHKKQIALRYHA